MFGLYLHIPFCNSKCPYCDFNSYAGKEALMSDYVDALLTHIRQDSPSLPSRIDTLFIGGGTPTALPVSLLEKLLNGVRSVFSSPISEFTVEANPKTVTLQTAKLFAEVGVNRMSIGLQAWQDSLLRRIGRTHTRADFLRTVDLLRSVGITNLNADVMYGLPGQTVAEWEQTLTALTDLSFPHLSCYSLTIAEGTPFARSLPAPLPSEDEEREMNHLSKTLLERSDLFRYEISNYAREGFACRHNLNYWKDGEYAAFGAGASGFRGGVRYTWCADPALYIAQARNGAFVPSETETVSDPIGETIMLALRLTEGVNEAELQRRFGDGCLTPYRDVIRRHCDNGLLCLTADGFALTDRGFDLANTVMADFL